MYYLRATILDLDYAYSLKEITTSTHKLDALYLIHSEKADVLCLSGYIWNIDYICSLVSDIKSLFPSLKLVLGGPEAHNPSLSKILSDTDIIITGSGEAKFRHLASCGFDPFAALDDIAEAPLGKIPFPYLPDDLELNGRLLYFESYRGCPFACVYCLSANDHRRQMRYDLSLDSEIQRMHNEIDSLVALKPKTIKFIDRSFNVCPEMAREIWRYVISLDCKCDFHFEVYPETLNEQDFQILCTAPAKRIRFETGIQSTNPKVLKDIKRPANPRKALMNISRIRQNTQIRIHADLLAGLPGEDLASIQNSLNELCLTFPHEIQLGMLKILPDTPMQAIATERRYIHSNTPPYPVLQSDALSFADIHYLEELSHIINLYWNKGDFVHLMKSLLKHEPAHIVFDRLLTLHIQNDYATHSVDRYKRFQIALELVKTHYAFADVEEALLIDWEPTGINPKPVLTEMI